MTPLDFPPTIHVHGFSPRKRTILRRYIPDRHFHFPRHGKDVPPGATLLLWGAAAIPIGAPQDIHIVRVEDGFLRSVGLGADLIEPLSWVFDRNGLYFDATRASDLENILNTADFSEEELTRARALRERIVAAGLTKYNVGSRAWTRPEYLVNRRVVLVPGQVESDASIRLGAPGLSSNLDLLKSARKAEPDAYILYKPHPDVLAGLRAQGQAEEQANSWCDEIVTDAPMGDLLQAVDAVHVMTSLAGFEALLRGKAVVCHGLPFYAGWGLTQDRIALPRRKRHLTLDELTAGALLRYPLYTSRLTDALASPEQALEDLLAWRARHDHNITFWRRILRIGLGVWARRRDAA